ncbi:MAG: 50S ribosomal protein L5 [Peptoniphilaceae bacterium]|nr:50S ribosomal protein L5 [Peptoniphilaceae bacterium]MDY6085210.1 50S ribosomal protein L5 [Peptoniphilaceae bacterium]
MSQQFIEHYKNEVVPALMKEFSYENIMQVPKLEKIVINCTIGDAKENPKLIETAAKELEQITGQKAVIVKAKRSVANFKLREGMPIATKVTLRHEKMYDFLEKLIAIALPRVRDFRGVPTTSFDGRGNYAMGVREQLIFPEINYDDVDAIHGMDIIIVTTAKTDEEAKSFLTHLGMPFAK